MTPEEPSGEDRPLDPAQEQAVSDLLAGARAERSVPADVSARLDDVLAGLVADRAGVDLAGRRRRRWPGLLVAAAAVTVVGLGLGNVLETGLGGAADQSGGAGVASDESQVEAGPEADAPAGARAETDDGAAAGPKVSPDSPLAGSTDPVRRLMRLRSDSLALDVQRLAEFALVTDQGRSAPQALAACARPEAARNAEVLAVRFDGAPATLVLRAPQDGVRRADVYACDDATAPLATTSVTVD